MATTAFAWPRVLVLGGTTFDHIVYLPGLPQGQPATIHQCGFAEHTGSTGTGKALALQQLGVPVKLISATGTDDYGRQIRQYLQRKELAVQWLDDPAGTERHINLMDAQGKRLSIFATTSSETLPGAEEWLPTELASHDLIVLNIIAYCRPWAARVAASGKPVWTDLHDYDGESSYHQPFIDAAQYIHLSSDNLPDYRPLMENLIGGGKQLAICTHAEKGASLLCPRHGCIEVDAEQVPITDTNGAGDSFFAGFLFGWMQQLPHATCLQMGTRAAALCLQSGEIVSPALSPQLLL